MCQEDRDGHDETSGGMSYYTIEPIRADTSITVFQCFLANSSHLVFHQIDSGQMPGLRSLVDSPIKRRR